MRFLAAGCSNTRHCWPTWADYISSLFDSKDYYNLGIPGGDNANIARTVIATAQPNDLVIILWTGFDRFNLFSDEIVQPQRGDVDNAMIYYSGMDNENITGGWTTTGCIVSDKDFFINHYNRVERFRTTLDYVKLVELHSKEVGYKVFNFSMTPWYQGEIEKTIDQRIMEMHNRSGFEHFYLESNIETVRKDTCDIVVSHKYAESDTHPTPFVQWKWAIEHVAPEVGLQLPDLYATVLKDQERVLAGEVD